MIRLKAHSGSIESSTAHGDRMVSGGFDQSICLWSRSGSLVKKLKKAHDHMIRCLTVFVDSSLSKDKKDDEKEDGSGDEGDVAYLVSGSWDCTLKVWALQTGKLIHVLEGHSHRIKSIVSIDQRSVSTEGHIISASDDNTLKLWDIKLGQCLKSIDAHSHFILSVCACYNIKLAKESNNNVTEDSNTKTAEIGKESATTEQQQEQQEGEGRGDGQEKTVVGAQVGTHLIASSSSDNTLQLRDLYSGNLIHDLLHLMSNKTTVSSTVFCPKSDKCKMDILCAGCDNGRILVFDVSSFTLLATLEGHEAQVTSMCLSLSSSSSLLLSVSKDGYLRSWLLNERTPGDIKADIAGILKASATTSSGKAKANDKQHSTAASSAKKQQYHLFTCSSTNSVLVAQETQSHENGETVVRKIKNSEELIIGGSDGLLLVLSITTVVNESDFDAAQGTGLGTSSSQIVGSLSDEQASTTITDGDVTTTNDRHLSSSTSLPAIQTTQSMESTSTKVVEIGLSSSSLDESGLPTLTSNPLSNGVRESSAKNDTLLSTGSSGERGATDGSAVGDTTAEENASTGTGTQPNKSSLLNYLKSTANEEFQMSLFYENTGDQGTNTGSDKGVRVKSNSGNAITRIKKDGKLYKGSPRNSFESTMSTDSDTRIRQQRVGRSVIQNTKQSNNVPAYCLLAEDDPTNGAMNIDIAAMLIDTDMGKPKASSKNRKKTSGGASHRPLDLLIASGKKY